MYARLPEISRYFKRVYLHNIDGDGYSLRNVDQSKLRKLHWPQPYEGPVAPFFNRNNREKKLVAICGAHNPKFRKPELYSERIKSISKLNEYSAIDLYGRGWDNPLSLKNAWWSYWFHRTSLMKAYRGSCENKLEVMSRYHFALCYENMPMRGYVTEKIFDCFYAGCVPVYWGGADIADTIPKECFIPREEFKDERTLVAYIDQMCDSELAEYKQNIARFLNGETTRAHVNFLEKELLPNTRTVA